MDINRWKSAHEAEKRHETHQFSLPSAEVVDSVLDFYGLSPGVFRDKRVLAVGGGTGLIHTLTLPKMAISVDPITDEVKDTIEDSSANAITGIGEKLPFSDNSFHYIICQNVLDHVIDPTKTLNEINRVLIDSGKLIFNINVFGCPKLVRRLLNHVDTPHPHHFSAHDIEDLFKQTGFKIEWKQLRQLPISDGNLKRKIAVVFFNMQKLWCICSLA